MQAGLPLSEPRDRWQHARPQERVRQRVLLKQTLDRADARAFQGPFPEKVQQKSNQEDHSTEPAVQWHENPFCQKALQWYQA